MSIAVFSAAAFVAADAPSPNVRDLQWPVALEKGVSSGFCDYRDGRFHAGIDVRTYGTEGIACVAVDDGWVTRIRASSRGYGKAVHLRLDSGVQILYAHLAEFVPALEDTLWIEQQRAGKYTVDVPLPDGRFRFRRGQVLAYSGSTGATAPHLHFEVRTLADEPLNPLTNGFALRDREHPTVPRMAFVPLSADARIEGRCYPLEIEPRRIAAGRYAIDDTLRLQGDVGVAATVVDKINSHSGNTTPFEMQVWSDGTQLSRVAFDRFSFEEVRHVDFALDMGALRARGTDVYSLYERPGDPRRHVDFVRGGRISPAPSTRRVHDGRLVAIDAAGNRTEVAFVYVDSIAGAHARAISGQRWRTSHLAVDQGGDFFRGNFAVIAAEGEGSLLTERGPGDERDARTEIVRASDFAVGGAAFDARIETAQRTAILADTSGVIVCGDGVQIAYAKGDVYGDEVVFAKWEGDARPGRQRSLKAQSRALRFGPVGLVFKKSPTIRFAATAPVSNAGIFRSAEANGPWSYVASSADSTGWSASLDRPGVFAVFRDVAAPWIGSPRVVRAKSYATGKLRNEIHVPIDDEGSGFDDARTEVYLGGVRQIWRWNFAAKKIIVAIHDDSILGEQLVRIVAFDRIGNSSSADATVTVEAPPSR